MKLIKSLLIFSILLVSSISFSQTNKVMDCKILKNCELHYVEEANAGDFIIIKNNKHIEYLQNSKYYIKSDLNWVNDCEYNATMTEITVPDFPFKPGEIMNVKFEKIINGIVYGVSTVRGKKFPITFKLSN